LKSQVKIDLLQLDREIRKEGYQVFCGVDEAGRGPLAGPVYAAAVILPESYCPAELDDSKKLTEKKRTALFDELLAHTISYGIASASPEEIDTYNILNATFLAMNRAIAQLDTNIELALVDGNTVSGIQYPARCFVGGDGRSAAIAAASILAKVSRDRYMCAMAEQYPQYGFEKHKGYGTKLHYEALRTYGPSPLHRRTFLRKMHGGSNR
jgi:ribonuclease HII